MPNSQLLKLGLPVICALILCCILFAGLFPFHRPDNQVSWLRNNDGLRFGRYGVVISSGTLTTARSPVEEACSIEIWLQPGTFHNSRTILTFRTSGNPRQFSLRKWETGLVLRNEVRSKGRELSVREAFLANAFADEKPTFISISSDGRASKVYVDGAFARLNRDFALAAKDLTGQLVIGSSPVASDGWYGELLGLGVYRRNLTPAQVLRHYRAWTTGKASEIADDESPVAVYSFDERLGTVVHNRVSGGPALYIPQHFALLDQPMLQDPWTEFRWSWKYWLNILINVAGFVPFGFFFCAWLSQAHRSQAAKITLLAGTVTSLAIELIQGYLPTRNSGVADLLTNTLGTYVGVVTYGVVSDRITKLGRIRPVNLESERSPSVISMNRFDKRLAALDGVDLSSASEEQRNPL